MRESRATPLLNSIFLIPLSILFIFFIFTTVLIINYNSSLLEHEIRHIKNDYITFYKDIVKKEVYKIYNLIEYSSNKDNYVIKGISLETRKKIALNRIEAMKYDENEYIFIIDYKGDFLVHPNNNLAEKNQINLKNTKDTPLTKKIINQAKEGEGFITYKTLKEINDPKSDKISFVKGYTPWGWAIGYGFYPNNILPRVEKEINNQKKRHNSFIKKIILVNVLLTVLLSIVLIIFSDNIKKIFFKYKRIIEKKEIKNRKKDQIIYHQSKMATIGELLNIISHQWRQPLSQINSLTLDTYLEQKQGSLNEDILKKNMSNIEDITKYLSQTIDDFGNYFIQEKDKKPFLCNNALNSSLKILAPTLKNIDIQMVLSSQNRITGFITLFQQVILTIITNSLDAFNINNIKNPGITIKSYDKENYTYLEISDNAGGIKEENINKIFDLYYSTKIKHSPSGLGLYIAKKIIENTMKGYIRAQNIPNGVKFTIKVQNNGTK